jgi:hypothetical protein
MKTIIINREKVARGGHKMIERRKVQRRRYKAYSSFPANDHKGKLILSERRNIPTRRCYDINVGENQFYYKMD